MKHTEFIIIIISVCCVLVPFKSTAQEPNTIEVNPVSVDRQQIAYFSDDVMGNEALWDFSNIEYNDKIKTDTCIAISDTTYYVYDKKRALTVLNKNGILYKTSEESPLWSINYKIPQLMLKYSMQYGESVCSSFSSDGTYCGKNLYKEDGEVRIMALAFGRIIIGDCDTIPNVMKLSLLKTSSIAMSSDSSKIDSVGRRQLIEERSLWFVKHDSIPCFETVLISCYDGEEKLTTYKKAYAYNIDHSNQSDSSLNKDDTDETLTVFEYSLDVNGNIINIDYSITKSATLKILVCDVMGRLYRNETLKVDSGEGQSYSIDCNGMKHGQYIIYINVEGDVYCKNIYL